MMDSIYNFLDHSQYNTVIFGFLHSFELVLSSLPLKLQIGTSAWVHSDIDVLF